LAERAGPLENSHYQEEEKNAPTSHEDP